MRVLGLGLDVVRALGTGLAGRPVCSHALIAAPAISHFPPGFAAASPPAAIAR
jgi:hypothetical protein